MRYRGARLWPDRSRPTTSAPDHGHDDARLPRWLVLLPLVWPGVAALFAAGVVLLLRWAAQRSAGVGPEEVGMWAFAFGALVVGWAYLLVAAGLLAPPTRRPAALAAAGLFAGVLPANVKVAVDARRSKSTAYRVGTLLRLPLQAPLIAWALRVRRAAT